MSDSYIYFTFTISIVLAFVVAYLSYRFLFKQGLEKKKSDGLGGIIGGQVFILLFFTFMKVPFYFTITIMFVTIPLTLLYYRGLSLSSFTQRGG